MARFASGPNTVLIDATAIPENFGGVGRYLEGLIQASERKSGLTIVARAQHTAHFAALAPAATVITAPAFISGPAVRFVWEQIGLPLLAIKLRSSVLHSPHYTFPLSRRRPAVVTIHDATFFSHPQFHSRLKRTFFTWWTRRALARKLVVVVPSAATESELRRYVNTIRAQIVVAHHGVDPQQFHPASSESITEFRANAGLGATEKWIAFLGTIEPRKNVGNLIRAHRELSAQWSETPLLLIAGARGWDSDALAVLDSSPPEQVRALGYVPAHLLSAFLGGAEVVAYPSVGEGFGLPVLEAMASGACVLTSRELSLPEVGGDAVHYSGFDVRSLRDELETLLDDSALRHRLRSAGVARAATFTWNHSALRHEAAYASAIGATK